MRTYKATYNALTWPQITAFFNAKVVYIKLLYAQEYLIVCRLDGRKLEWNSIDCRETFLDGEAFRS